ncbi:hypothetical protein CRM90_08995 [Mycobacterium sp. ENV421]|uniref:hypothetical protein n=1 Tax=Mycobacterium sp. ENV421 TaxID=1213407 RepID=UPI000C9CD13B|nr:hypothetical protein [Mycobacterium sp. ENV421]PND58117.1 hypothetical protein CRM90_08995 [Mycobacterium sp. ENV421]
MSGQLVGEVISAAASLKARKVSDRGFQALIAIAEKAGADRTASVRWDHIRAGLYWPSRRTAERAVHELVQAGLVRIAKAGFKNQHGQSRAPVYEVLALVDTDNQVSESTVLDTDNQMSESKTVDSDKSDVDSAKSGGGFRHSGVVLDVSFDVSIDRAAVRAAIDRCPSCDQFGRLDNLEDCPRHPNFRTNRKPA